MHWAQVYIVDLAGKSHNGESACDFVVEKLAGKLTIKLFSGGTFAFKTDKKFVVSPDGVYSILSDKLAGQIRSLKVDGPSLRSPLTFVPKRTTINPINTVPKYTLTFELGDLDALFEPV